MTGNLPQLSHAIEFSNEHGQFYPGDSFGTVVNQKPGIDEESKEVVDFCMRLGGLRYRGPLE